MDTPYDGYCIGWCYITDAYVVDFLFGGVDMVLLTIDADDIPYFVSDQKYTQKILYSMMSLDDCVTVSTISK